MHYLKAISILLNLLLTANSVLILITSDTLDPSNMDWRFDSTQSTNDWQLCTGSVCLLESSRLSYQMGMIRCATMATLILNLAGLWSSVLIIRIRRDWSDHKTIFVLFDLMSVVAPFLLLPLIAIALVNTFLASDSLDELLPYCVNSCDPSTIEDSIAWLNLIVWISMVLSPISIVLGVKTLSSKVEGNLELISSTFDSIS